MQAISNELRMPERKVRNKKKSRRSSARGSLKRYAMNKEIVRKWFLNRLDKRFSSGDGSIDLSWFLGIHKYLGARLNPFEAVAKIMENL